MDLETAKQIEQARRLSVNGLRRKYAEVVGEEARSNHKEYLFRRIAWRLQAQAEGDLSERARRRALEIADDADLRLRAPKQLASGHGSVASRTGVRGCSAKRDPRLPIPGTLLTRAFKGETYVVKVLAEGFEFNGQRHASLTAIATAITGTRWNGFNFFRLLPGRKKKHA